MIDEIIRVVQFVIDILCKAAPLKDQLDASVELLGLHLLNCIKLWFGCFLCLLDEGCALEEGLESADHVLLVLPNLRTLGHLAKVAASLSFVFDRGKHVLSHLLKLDVNELDGLIGLRLESVSQDSHYGGEPVTQLAAELPGYDLAVHLVNASFTKLRI